MKPCLTVLVGILISLIVAKSADAQLPRTYPDPVVPQAPQYGGQQLADGVVLFSATWCAACPPSKALAQRHGVPVYDLDRDRAIAQRYGVRVVPTWLVVRGGRVVDQREGTPAESWLRDALGTKPSPIDYGPGRAPAVPDRPTLRDTTVFIQAGRAAGSGVVVGSHEGIALVLTAQHVIEDGGPFHVVTRDGKRHPAEIFGASAPLDLAALKISPGYDLPAAPLADEEPREGDPITLCGYGGGNWRELRGKVTGYYTRPSSGLNEAIDLGTEVISIPGDSGGPIYNDRGEVVAILWGGPATGPRPYGRMIRTQAIRQEQIDGWFAQRTNVLAEVFGPHSQVRRNQEAIARMEATLQASGYSRDEIAQLRQDIVRLQGQVERNTQLAETARQLYNEWSPIRDDVIAMVRNGLGPEKQAILDQANANAQRLVQEQKTKDAAIIAAAEARVEALKIELETTKQAAVAAKESAVRAEEGVAQAKVSILETVANALGNYQAAREGGASPTEAGLSTAEQVLRERERNREATIIDSIQAGLAAREQGAGGISIAQAVLGALITGGLGGGLVWALRRRAVGAVTGVAGTASDLLLSRLIDRLGPDTRHMGSKDSG